MSPSPQSDARRRLTDQELQERARELSRPAGSLDLSAAKVVGYLGLRVEEEWFCVPVSMVKEVRYKPRTSRVPFIPAFVSGLFNLRGEVMGLINLATLLGLSKGQTKIWNFGVLLNEVGSDAVTAGFLADEVCEVHPAGESSYDRIPSTIPPERARFFTQTFRFESTSYTILNVENILSHPDLNPQNGD